MDETKYTIKLQKCHKGVGLFEMVNNETGEVIERRTVLKGTDDIYEVAWNMAFRVAEIDNKYNDVFRLLSVNAENEIKTI